MYDTGSWGDVNKWLFIPERELTLDSNRHNNKVQLDEPMRFIGIHYKNMNERLHTGVEMAQHSSMGDSSQKLETWVGHTTQPLSAKLIGEYLSWGARLPWASFSQLGCLCLF